MLSDISHRTSKVEIYIHVVWTTKLRSPLISSVIEKHLYDVIEAESRRLGCTVYAIGGMPDHVHLVVSLPSTISIAQLLKQIKGASSRSIKHKIPIR